MLPKIAIGSFPLHPNTLPLLALPLLTHRSTGGHSTFAMIATAPVGLEVSRIDEGIRAQLPDFRVFGDEHPVLQAPAVDDEVEILELVGLGPDRRGIPSLFMALLDAHGALPRTLDFQCSDAGFRGVRMLQLRCMVILPRSVGCL